MKRFYGFDLGDAESAVSLLEKNSDLPPTILEVEGVRSFITAYAALSDGTLLIGENACYAKEAKKRKIRFKSRFLNDVSVEQDIRSFAAGVLMIFQEFRVFEEAVVGDGAGEHIAVEAAEDAAPKKVIADESRQSVEEWRESVGFFPLQVEDFRASGAIVAFRLCEKTVVILVSIMDDVGFQAFRVLLGHEGMLLAVEKTQFVLAVEAHQPVRVPVTGLHPALADVVSAADGETVVGSMLEVKLPDGFHEFIREPLVRIETEHPVVLGVLQRQVLLRTIADIGVHEYARASLFGQRHGIVLAARVGHDDLIANLLQRAYASFDILGFVEGGDDAGDHC